MGDKPEPSASRTDPSSPFFLGTHDRPGDHITPVKLKLDNFDDWAHNVRVALRSRRKFGFLDGSIEGPKAPFNKDDFETVHCMLVSWLMNTIDPEVKSLLSNYDNAKKLWDDLHERFSLVDGPRIHKIKSDLHECSQTNNTSVAIYFGKLSMLWDELDKHEPIISCTCGKCECDIGKAYVSRRDTDRLHRFLLGLDRSSEYASIRSVLLSQDPLPTLNRAFQTISQEERVKGIDKAKETTVGQSSGYVVRSQPTRSPAKSSSTDSKFLSKEERSKLRCTHCNKAGHDINMCFELMEELPDWWYELKGAKPPKRGTGKVNGKTNCTGSSSAGHTRVITDHTSNRLEEEKPVNVCGIPTPRFTGKWIIDTGCSQHVTGTLSLLTNVRTLGARMVRLPDGQNVQATRIGRVMITNSLILDNVLYVPKLTCNLFMPSQLCDARIANLLLTLTYVLYRPYQRER
ncbi:uncharacterized protein LOC141612899 [Silene latifolia]|uniref:uncharacterized protein LOC141612899 n=1 Tax=Silene latifolia TaxID=37657 RepID=UPI003D77F4FE